MHIRWHTYACIARIQSCTSCRGRAIHASSARAGDVPYDTPYVRASIEKFTTALGQHAALLCMGSPPRGRDGPKSPSSCVRNMHQIGIHIAEIFHRATVSKFYVGEETARYKSSRARTSGGPGWWAPRQMCSVCRLLGLWASRQSGTGA